MSNYEIAELTMENGQLGMNGVIQTRPAIWDGRTSETLESIVNQAAWKSNSGEKWAVTPAAAGDPLDAAAKKRTRSESNCGSLGVKGSNCIELEMSGRESESNTNNTMSWANSFDSSPSSNGKTDDFTSGGVASEKREGDGETKTETTRRGSSRRSRAAAVHNLSERRRRDRINQKMKTLQKLVPNASKTDKASMLDEVIEYLKQLQAQVQMMSNCNNARMNIPNMNLNMPSMNMNIPNMNMMMQQYQLQLSLLSRMGNNTAPFLPPPFLLPSSSLIQPPAPSQSMNMEMYNKMAELYLQQVNQGTQGTSHQ